MDADILAFFDGRPGELALYETLVDKLLRSGCRFTVKVQKTQISFFGRYMFVCVSFARVKKKADMPPQYLVVTFGLDHPERSGRIAVCTEAAPNRWTHHVVVDSPEEIDAELTEWLCEAYRFAERKQRNRR